MLIDCHVHLFARRRLAGLMKWMHGFYPEHPIPRSVTLEQCIAYYDTIPVDYIFNLVYPIRDDETEPVNRFNFELHQRYPWIIPFGGLQRRRPGQGRDRRAVSRASTGFSASSSTRSSSRSTRWIRG